MWGTVAPLSAFMEMNRPVRCRGVVGGFSVGVPANWAGCVRMCEYIYVYDTAAGDV